METQIDIYTATREQLIEYGREELGLDIKANMRKDDVLQLVAKQLGVDVQTALKQDDASPALNKEHAAQKKQKRVKIRIYENATHPQRIPVGVNGVMYTIVPGAVVEVPQAVVEVLRNAVKVEFQQVTDAQGNLRMRESRAQAYPFEVLG